MSTLEGIRSKIFTKDTLAGLKKQMANKNTAFTNGCFDIIHLGHVTYLASASDLGDFFVIGVNADASVKRLKGPSRPVKDEYSRALILASLSFVDAVVIFEEDTPLELITELRPHTLIKGGDYDPTITDKNDPKYIVGRDLVENVQVIPFVDGHSSSGLIEKMR